jgi:hypothetical protein
MADPILFWYALAAALVFLLVGLEEVPWRFNVARVARRVRASARRRKVAPIVALGRLRAQTHVGARALAVFAAVSVAYFLYALVAGPREAPWMALGATLSLGLVFLSGAFLVWAPRLFDAVSSQLASESATTNSHASDAEPVHGPRP